VSERAASRLGTVLGALAAIVAIYLFIGFNRGGCGGGPILNDTNRLRQIVGCAFATPPRRLPMKGGVFDPYEFVRRGNIPREDYDLFRSERSGTGPTDAEIERGDYTNFPWECYRGDGKLEGPPFPLLWERMPDKRGGRIIAFSDGSATYCERGDLERFEDTDSLRQLIGIVVGSGTLPMKNGAFDPYRFIKKGLVGVENLKIFNSCRAETGPSAEEIKDGDYTNFPWERYRGDGKLEGPPFPLLWEKKPDEDGKVLVGLSDGTVVYREPR